jgi:hypothetical protein
VQVSPECISKFNELKLNKKLKFIIYKLSDDYKEIVVEEESENGDWDFFREKLLSAESKSKTVRHSHTPIFRVVINSRNRERSARAQDTPSMTSPMSCLPEKVRGKLTLGST